MQPRISHPYTPPPPFPNCTSSAHTLPLPAPPLPPLLPPTLPPLLWSQRLKIAEVTHAEP